MEKSNSIGVKRKKLDNDTTYYKIWQYYNLVNVKNLVGF